MQGQRDDTNTTDAGYVVSTLAPQRPSGNTPLKQPITFETIARRLSIACFAGIVGLMLDYGAVDHGFISISTATLGLASNQDDLMVVALPTVGLAYLGIIIWLGKDFFQPSSEKAKPLFTTANFRDASPYGDAQLADREAIQRAMMGHNNPDAPQFEE